MKTKTNLKILIGIMSLIILAAFLTPVIAVLADETEPPVIEQTIEETAEESGVWDEIKEKINNVIMPVIVSLGGLNIVQLFFIITTIIKNAARKAKDSAENAAKSGYAQALQKEIAELKANSANYNADNIIKICTDVSTKMIADGFKQLTNLLTEIVGGAELSDAKLNSLIAAFRHATTSQKAHEALADIPTAAVVKRQEIALKTLIDEVSKHNEADKEEMILKIKEAMENAKLGNVSAI